MKCLVLAAGFPQIALISEIKSRGIETICADYNENPVARKYADKYYQASTLDVDKIKTIAINENVDFIITACTDQALLTMAKVSEDLHLPCYIDYQTALNVTNKKYMKKTFIENGIPTAKFIVTNAIDKEKLKDLTYPLIVKPVDCNSSKGVRKCESYEELESKFIEAKKLSRTNTAIVEEFFCGRELSVDGFVVDGKVRILSVSVSDKVPENDKFVIFRSFYPINISETLERKINTIAQKIVDSFGLKNSPLLIQMLENNSEIKIIEFSARTGGGIKYKLIDNCSGFDVIKGVVDITLGETPNFDTLDKKCKFGTNVFVYCYPGEFECLSGFEALKEKSIIYDYYLFKNKGANVGGMNNSGDRIAGYTILANTYDELINNYIIANQELKVLDKYGNDLMRHDILVNTANIAF